MDPIPDFTPDYADSTKVHPLGLAALFVAVVCVLAARRRLVPAVFIGLAALIPSAQRIAVAGLDFNFIRVLVLAGLLRAIMRNELLRVRWCAVDACVLAGMSAKLVGSMVTLGIGPGIVGILGAEFEAVGTYLVMRSMLRSADDLRATLSCVALTTIVALAFFLVERSTGRNLFSMFGGVDEITNVREGKLRCQGAIAHPILAGCFFAAFLPMWIGMWVGARGALRYLLAFAGSAAVAITICSASSTPIGAVAQAVIGWAAFPIRRWLRYVWIAAIATVFLLHLIMKAPVWHLISRVDLVGGSTGYHRTHLIDQAVNRINEWWLFGTRTTAHWGWGLEDVTNQFVLDGVRGGLIATLALVLSMVFVFSYCGRCVRDGRHVKHRLSRGGGAEIPPDAALAFGVGVAVFVHIGVFLAVSYFGQTVAVWQFILAAGASVAGWKFEGVSLAQPAPHILPGGRVPLQGGGGVAPSASLVRPGASARSGSTDAAEAADILGPTPTS